MRWTLPLILAASTLQAVAQQTPTADLTSFVADASSPRGVRIHWATATENGTGRFVVERSMDGWEWTLVNELPAVGQSTRHVSYETWDTQAPTGVVQYRLLEVTTQGLEIISEVFSVQVVSHRGLSVESDHMPGRFVVRATVGQLQDVQLLNNRGQFMPVQLDVRPDAVWLNAELVPSGTYYIQAVVDGTPLLRSVIIGG
ncbi:MAG: hypothetical protein JNM31_03245 [Flavobacteriales bacterium]|nr:hypothetical protein [Flavobacteriales bacterium]